MNKVKFKRYETDNQQFEFEIIGLNLKFKTNDDISLVHLAKYLIDVKKIHLTSYERKSPYKVIKKNYGIHTPDAFYSDYIIEYYELKNKKLELKQNKITTSYTHAMYTEKQFECFIPDLLEVFVERGWLERMNGEMKVGHISNIANHLIFDEIVSLITPNELMSKGYCVPNHYKELYNSFM